VTTDLSSDLLSPHVASGRIFPSGRTSGEAADVDVVVPVHDEERVLESSVRRLHSFLTDRFPLSWRITIADNASTDRTAAIADRLHRQLDHVEATHLPLKGRGRALRDAWAHSDAPIVAYTDVDLSTDLAALAQLVEPLWSGQADIAIGSRLRPGADVVRGFKREVISRTYNVIVRTALHSKVTDAQCGFKAVRGEVARALVPLVEDDGWFFDTELLVRAERAGLRIHEVPVHWVDDPDSRVRIVRTALDDLRGIHRLRRSRSKGASPDRPSPTGERRQTARSTS
jgi:glycosyltransferase involved in cell wall biosynthesis